MEPWQRSNCVRPPFCRFDVRFHRFPFLPPSILACSLTILEIRRCVRCKGLTGGDGLVDVAHLGRDLGFHYYENINFLIWALDEPTRFRRKRWEDPHAKLDRVESFIDLWLNRLDHFKRQEHSPDKDHDHQDCSPATQTHRPPMNRVSSGLCFGPTGLPWTEFRVSSARGPWKAKCGLARWPSPKRLGTQQILDGHSSYGKDKSKSTKIYAYCGMIYIYIYMLTNIA